MAKHVIIEQASDHRWALIEVPDDYRDGNELPPARATDRFFDTEAEASAAWAKITDGDGERAGRKPK